jgi:hypothetical protein
MQVRHYILHPFLFSAYAILSLLAFNIDQILPGEALRSMFIAFAGTILVLLVSRFLLKDWLRASYATTLTIILFFSYGHVYHLLEGVSVGPIVLGRHRFLITLWLLLYGLGLWWIWKKSAPFPRLNTYLNLFGAIVLLFPIFGLGTYAIRSQQTGGTTLPTPTDQSVGGQGGYEEELPDIYYIILDAYAREDILADVYHFDNSDFIESLEAWGFFVAGDSHSNYTQTSLSLSSALNFDYVEAYVDPIDPRSDDLTPLGDAIKHSRVRTILEDLGYQTIAFGTGFSRTEISDADYYLTLDPDALTSMSAVGSINIFESMLLQTTGGMVLSDAIYLLPDELRPDLQFPFRAHRERILFAFDEVEDLPETEGPKFVFMHIVSPHPPFVFGPNGEEIPHTDAYTLKDGVFQGDRAAYIEQYTDQLSFLNEQTLTMLEHIITDADVPPLIILQSDHGPDASSMDGDAISPVSYLKERMSILNTFFLPGCDAEQLYYPSVTPVNNFRILFDACFGGNNGLLEDRSYNSTYQTPYDLTDITNSLH